MKEVDQTRLIDDPGTGDCFRACVASVLELPLEAVPHFCGDRLRKVDLELDGWSIDNWFMGVKVWSKLVGLEVELVKNVEDWKGRDVHGDHVIASGPSPRDPENTLHGVVMNTEEEIVHDPHPSRAGINSVLDYTVFYGIKDAVLSP